MRLGPFEIRFRYVPHKQTGTLTASQFNALMLEDLHQRYETPPPPLWFSRDFIESAPAVRLRRELLQALGLGYEIRLGDPNDGLIPARVEGTDITIYGPSLDDAQEFANEVVQTARQAWLDQRNTDESDDETGDERR